MQAGKTRTPRSPPVLRPGSGDAGPRHDLDFIGWKHGTDKAAGGHGYLNFYERFFEALRDRPIRLLEVGVSFGQSVLMWEEYFQQALIIGADINPDAGKYASDRIVIEIADQSNVAHLVSLGARHGPFDIIIDDGSHHWSHQITTLQHLFPFLKPGGFFVIEDIDTSFGTYAKTYRGKARVSAFRYLQKIVEYTVADAQLDIAAEPDPFIRMVAHATEFIALHRGTAILRRQGLAPAERLRLPAAPGADLPGERDPEAVDEPGFWASLTVHEPGVGDVTASARAGVHHDYMLLGGLRGDRYRTIQGFAVQLADGSAGELHYRALLSDDTWTEWTSNGDFVGSRGLGVGIRGFAVRLAGALASRFQCSYSGSFVGHAELVEAGDGAECRAEIGELEAMRIILHRRA